MNDNAKILLTGLNQDIRPFIQIFENLNKEHRKIDNFEISVQLESISNRLHNLQAQIKQLNFYLEQGIQEKDRLQFLNSYLD